ncbi:IS3 family transposase [Mycoplasmatota bacterium zrk1]
MKKGLQRRGRTPLKEIKRKEFEVINELHLIYGYPIKSMCEFLGVSRDGYYKWNRRKGTTNRYIRKRQEVLPCIIKLHNTHKTWGYHRIAASIRKNTKLIFSDWLIHKICKDNKIKSRARIVKYSRGKEHITYSNLVKSWHCTRPFEIVVTDTTHIKTKNRKWDLTLYIDVFNNEIISYDLVQFFRGLSTQSHLRALRIFLQEKEKRGYSDLDTILHSDQGTVYTSSAYNYAYKNYNIKRSMSRIGTPTDNPINEAINGWMKDELYKEFNLYNSTNVPKTIESYIQYHRNDRFTYALKYKTPIQYRTELGFL